MTLSRIATNIQKTTGRIRIRPEDLRVRVGVSYITFAKAPGITPALNDISHQLESTPSTGSQLFSQLEGSREVTVLFTHFYDSVINKIAQTYPPKIRKDNLVALAIHIPPEYLEQHGMLYFVVKQLNYF